jgi:hypothetical protein
MKINQRYFSHLIAETERNSQLYFLTCSACFVAMVHQLPYSLFIACHLSTKTLMPYISKDLMRRILADEQ